MDKRGFTLIEIMIVVAIVATLAAVAISGFIAYVHTSKRNLCLSNINMLNRAAETYVITAGLKNGDMVTLDMLSPKGDGSDGQKQFLIKNRPVCPIGGTYTYDPATYTWSCSANEKAPE